MVVSRLIRSKRKEYIYLDTGPLIEEKRIESKATTNSIYVPYLFSNHFHTTVHTLSRVNDNN